MTIKQMKKIAGAVCGLLGVVSLGLPSASYAAQSDREDELMQRLQMMERQMQAMQDELQQLREDNAPEKQMMELNEWRSQFVETRNFLRRDSQVFFRGGYSHMNVGRNNEVFTDMYEASESNGGKDGYYAGAGIEHSLTDDLWGFWDEMEVMGEIMFQWARFASNDSDSTRVVPTAVNALTGSSEDTTGVTKTMFTLTAAPKLKFFPGSNFRPWIIPVGWAFHVISPPSDAGTYLNAGMMFGAGAEYKYWKKMTVGVDFRYQLTSDNLDGVDTDHWTLGVYTGVGF